MSTGMMFQNTMILITNGIVKCSVMFYYPRLLENRLYTNILVLLDFLEKL